MSAEKRPSETNEAGANDIPSTHESAVAISANGESHLLRIAFGVGEAATILGVSEKTVRRLISRGLLRPSRALRHLLISRKEIDRFLEETC